MAEKITLSPLEKELVFALIVYRVEECGDKIPMVTQGTQWEFVEDILDEMHKLDYLAISEDSQSWRLSSPKGKKMLAKLVAMGNASLQFSIFQSFNFDIEVPDEVKNPETGELNPEIWDDRFNPDTEGNKEDMRLAMLEYVSEKLRREGKPVELDTTRIIFLQNLANGEYADDAKGFWHIVSFRQLFDGIKAIKDSAYKWEDLAPDDLEESFEFAGMLYAAGMVNLRKEEGMSCQECDTPLAMFETEGPVDECPNPECDTRFGDPDAGGGDEGEGDAYECPKCKRDIHAGQSNCYGCGSSVDFSLPSGSVSTETVTETETVEEDDWGYGYGYEPYGWYSPYDPVVDAMAFGFICGAILL